MIDEPIRTCSRDVLQPVRFPVNNPAIIKVPTKQSRNHFLSLRKTPETAIGQRAVDLNEEVAMNAIVAGVLTREAAKTQAIPHPLTLIALFCGVGLVASLAMASMGFDLGTAFF